MFKKQVKCSECGFLGVHYRLYAGSPDYSEIQGLSPQSRLDVQQWLQNQNATLGCFREQEYMITGVTSPIDGINSAYLRDAIDDTRICKHFERFRPGYNFRQHLEVQKERDQRRFLITVSLLSAAVGAAIATLVNLVWS